MKRNRLCYIVYCVFLLLIFTSKAKAKDQGNETILPAGTLLRCTLDEPTFSSKTADVGTPAVCPLAGPVTFDRIEDS